ncbi:YkgJ family cysteine cluster protein [Desulfovibrio oxyclinae]|jgi:hypothetical protein|uniref:YkgJ family cysteine cluster protein n=1 Tax=Desulfovibrio oxyclinae TaxID=63560 RepID=UPI000367781F|nr:YkgJ family cysteine cluster protein [Desulfovibrio oxyclinae]
MSQEDQTRDFLDSLPELKPGEKINFRCYPGITCFNKCCSDLNLVLAPYDVLRLRRSLGMSSRDFIHSFVDAQKSEGSHFPLLHLRMTDTDARSCPYVREEGCAVYPDRPGACRTYPLGRAARPDGEGGVKEQFFVVREDHCRGFEEPDEWDTDEWFADQGFDDYIRFNDRYMHIMSQVNQSGRMLNDRMVQMIMLCLYQIDDFQQFAQDMKLFERVEIDEARQQAVLDNEEAALEFGMDWLELLLLGPVGNLKPKV